MYLMLYVFSVSVLLALLVSQLGFNVIAIGVGVLSGTVGVLIVFPFAHAVRILLIEIKNDRRSER